MPNVQPMVRSRVTNPRRYQTNYWTYNFLSQGGYYAYAARDVEYVETRGHLWTYRRLIPNCDLGGSFLHMKFTDYRRPQKIDLHVGGTLNGYRAYNYVGDLNAIGSSPTDAEITNHRIGTMMMPQAMWTAGTRFIAQTSPTKSQASLMTALVELKREGLPRLSSDAWSMLRNVEFGKGKARGTVRGTGSDYLNWQFGIVPIVSDIGNLARSVLNADYLLSQLYRDSGKVVRRKAGSASHWSIVDESSTETLGYGYPTLATAAYSANPSKVFQHSKTSRAIWFSGAFMYHLPDETTLAGRLRKLAVDARYLYGLSLDPATFWNLVPWSWLIDWFINVGDLLQNLSDQVFNEQVLKYGYVMAHTVQTITTEATVRFANGHVATPSAVQTYDIKQREKASPFGFGLTFDGFSPSQLAILAALGVSQGL